MLVGKFDRDIEQLSRTAIFLSEIAITVKPRKRITVLADEPDNRILDSAQMACQVF